MNRPGEAIVHYQRAAELQTQTPIEALLSMGEIATCKILTREFSLINHIWLCTWFFLTCMCIHSWFDLFFCSLNSSSLFLQVTMMVLCRCSRRCSLCVRREDCSYQAPAPLLVRPCIYLKTLHVQNCLMCGQNIKWNLGGMFKNGAA